MLNSTSNVWFSSLCLSPSHFHTWLLIISLFFSSSLHFTSPATSRLFFRLPQCVVNLISELQEQMCRFQEEISTRIQEKRALEEKEARQGEPGGCLAQGCSPQVGLAGSDLSLSELDSWKHNGGQTVHVGRLDGWTHLTLLPHHSLSSSPLLF